MRKEDCFYLGKIVRKHSFKGEVVLKLDTDEPELYQDLESVFVEHGKNLIPFFIESSLLQKGNQLRVRFETVDNEQDAEAILGCNLYLPLSFLPKLEGNQFYFHEVVDFNAVDQQFGVIGKIVRIIDNTAQPLFDILTEDDQQVLIPMVDDFIVKIDRQHQQVLLNVPEGLIQMYLS